MSALLVDLLRGLDLQPGQSQRVWLDGYEIEIRRPQTTEPTLDVEEPMVDIWLTPPASAKTVTTVAQRGDPQLPLPMVVDESNLTPE